MLLDSIASLGRRWRQRAKPVAVAVPQTMLQGFIDEQSGSHVAGWMMDADNSSRRIPYEVVCLQTGRVLASGNADQYRYHLGRHGIGDGANAFHARLSQGVPAGGVGVRMPGSAAWLPTAAKIRTSFEPILHVAMDIVDNCNLRCPFCLYDYAGTRTTQFMLPETLHAALRLLPYTRDGQFWFSCLHEPTLHPELMSFIDAVPRALRRKLMFTTNLAKRMPDAYFDWLAQSGVYNINISIESRDPALYERMRKGARHRIFAENWGKLLAAFARVPDAPRLHYIAMAYKSNVGELPDLCRHLLEDCQASQVELRYTFDMAHIPAEFSQTEFLDTADWVRLRESLPAYPADRLLLITPPEPPVHAAMPQATPAEPGPAPRPPQADYYTMRVSWDGTLRVAGVSPDSRYGNGIEQDILLTNVNTITEPSAFMDALAVGALPGARV